MSREMLREKSREFAPGGLLVTSWLWLFMLVSAEGSAAQRAPVVAQQAPALPAQLPATPAPAAPAPGPLLVRGTVVRQTIDGTRPVVREQVTLHRVSAQDAGAVDSLVTDARGNYAFRVAAPEAQSMYLASARYGGIAYFSSPVQPGAPANAPSEIVVFDTTSAELRLQLQGRHVVVSAPDADGVRSVIDVLEISNDTVLTRVAGGDNRPTFSVLLPEQAREVTASQGDLGAGGVEFRAGRADIFLPLAPGLRQVVVTYKLPAAAYPVAIPLERTVSVLEVLLEEKGATAEGGGLVNKGGVTVDGKAFERYLGQNAGASAVVTLRAPGGIRGTSLPAWSLPVALGALTLGMIVLLVRRGPSAATVPVTPPTGATPADATRVAARAVDARPAHTPPGVAAQGAALPGDARPGDALPGDATPGDAPSGEAVTGDAVPGDAVPGDARPADSAPALDGVTRLARHVAAVDTLLEHGTVASETARAELVAYRDSLRVELVAALARRSGRR